jgi:hypothetical protein
MILAGIVGKKNWQIGAARQWLDTDTGQKCDESCNNYL